MKRLEQLVVDGFNETEELVDKTTNPFHRSILLTWWRHGLLEGAGRFDELAEETMMSDDPEYRVMWGEETKIFEGKDEVLGFYNNVAAETVMYITDSLIAVGDWGFSNELTFHHVAKGTVLELIGYEVEDSEKYYDVSTRQVFLWPFDDQARVAGERLYEDKSSFRIEEVPAEDVITPERSRELNYQGVLRMEEKYGPEFWVYRPEDNAETNAQTSPVAEPRFA